MLDTHWLKSGPATPGDCCQGPRIRWENLELEYSDRDELMAAVSSLVSFHYMVILLSSAISVFFYLIILFVSAKALFLLLAKIITEHYAY